MIAKTLNRFEFLLEKIPNLLNQISEEEFSQKPKPQKWSKKQILGHLIDSAANNHQRFVRSQFEKIPSITYDQNGWNQHGFYQQRKASELIRFWTEYNRFILALLKQIPESELKKLCRTSDPEPHDLEFLIVDYVDHLEHHLKQLVTY